MASGLAALVVCSIQRTRSAVTMVALKNRSDLGTEDSQWLLG